MSIPELLEGTGLDIGSGRQDAGDDAGIDSPNCLDQCRTQQHKLTCHFHRLFLLLSASQHRKI